MQDPLTKNEFNPRRSNQKFENARNRSTFHNQLAAVLRKRKDFVDKHLRINFRILHTLMPPFKELKEQIFHKQYLLGMGFNFGVHTHIQEIGGKGRYAIYNYVIIPEDKDMIKIIRT